MGCGWIPPPGLTDFKMPRLDRVKVKYLAMDYLIALANGMSPSTPLSECEINVCFDFLMFFEEGGILHLIF